MSFLREGPKIRQPQDSEDNPFSVNSMSKAKEGSLHKVNGLLNLKQCVDILPATPEKEPMARTPYSAASPSPLRAPSSIGPGIRKLNFTRADWSTNEAKADNGQHTPGLVPLDTNEEGDRSFRMLATGDPGLSPISTLILACQQELPFTVDQSLVEPTAFQQRQYDLSFSSLMQTDYHPHNTVENELPFHQGPQSCIPPYQNTMFGTNSMTSPTWNDEPALPRIKEEVELGSNCFLNCPTTNSKDSTVMQDWIDNLEPIPPSVDMASFNHTNAYQTSPTTDIASSSLGTLDYSYQAAFWENRRVTSAYDDENELDPKSFWGPAMRYYY